MSQLWQLKKKKQSDYKEKKFDSSMPKYKHAHTQVRRRQSTQVHDAQSRWVELDIELKYYHLK